MSFTLAEDTTRADIRVIGVGGAGGNAVNSMIERSIKGVHFVAVNTDSQDLSRSKADTCIQIGVSLTKGMGAGANPEIGRQAAEENEGEIRQALQGADIVFVAAGLGGGTGTGAAPVIARISKELGALTVGVVTKPFPFEGGKRLRNANSGGNELKEQVDTLITISNANLLKILPKTAGFLDGMKHADSYWSNAVKGLADLINTPGYINPDFADVRTIMQNAGSALIGIGTGRGEERADQAVRMAVNSPLLEKGSVKGAKGLLVNISASEETLSLAEIQEANTYLEQQVHQDAVITLGVSFDPSLGDEIRITVLATGFCLGEEGEEEIITLPRPMDNRSSRKEPKGQVPRSIPRQRRIFSENRKSAMLQNHDDSRFEEPAFLRTVKN